MEIQTLQSEVSLLIIEDNPGDVRIIEEVLRESSSNFYRLTSCSNLSLGIKTLNENKFDALILDLRLPDSSDIETLEIIRENDPDIPIVVLTIINNEEIGLAAIQSGAQDFLAKEQLGNKSLEKSIKFAIERKKLEQKIRDSENLFEITFELASVGMAHSSMEGKCLKVNHKCCEISGYEKEELLGKKVDFFTLKDDIKNDSDKMNQLITGEIPNYEIEKRIIKKDGNIIWVHVTRSLINSKNGPVIFSIIEDINIKKRTEAILTHAFNNYKTLAENTPEIINRFDKNLNFIYTNPSIRKLSGRSSENMIGRNLSDFSGSEQFKEWRKRFDKVMQTKRKQYYQDTMNTIEGEITLETIIVPEIDENRNVNSFLTISRDITERLEIQKEIQRKNILLEKILDNIPAGIWIVDENGSLMMYNKACVEIWGGVENMAIRKKPEFNGRWADTGKRIEDKEWASFRAYTKGETSLNEVINIECFNGKKKTILNSAVPMFGVDNKVIGVVVINQDITKLIEIENELKTSLKEKEMLMKEIHHRVKNNFQVIASLLNLQRSSLKNKSIEDVILESQNRVRSMAILHEKLYRSENVQNINFTVYLTDLIKSLEISYQNSERNISIELDIDEIFVSPDYAINLGLIINELLVNSLKHAFKNRSDGNICISLKEPGAEKIELIVKDNGTGINETIDIKNTDSLGMLLINSFVNQLNGTIELKRVDGTEFRMIFPKE